MFQIRTYLGLWVVEINNNHIEAVETQPDQKVPPGNSIDGTRSGLSHQNSHGIKDEEAASHSGSPNSGRHDLGSILKIGTTVSIRPDP